MGLLLPTVSVTPGPTYATMNNTAFTTIDSHTHAPGFGAPVLTPYLATVTKTANYTATTIDRVIFVDCTAGNITISLPQASPSLNIFYVIKKIDSTTNVCTISPFAGDTIELTTSQKLGTQNDVVTLVSNSATNWCNSVYQVAQGCSYQSVNGGAINTSFGTYTYEVPVSDPFVLYSGGVVTIRVAGKYAISAAIATVALNLATTSNLQIRLNKNSGTILAMDSVSGVGASNTNSAGISCIGTFAIGDTLKVETICTAGTTSNATSGLNYFNLERFN